MNNWNRKDRNPEETVQMIKDILEENGIHTKITNETEYNNLWYSNRVEFAELNGKGTNGKGISYEYAMASGYAEFMERLQSRMLFEGLFPNKDTEICKDTELSPEQVCEAFLCSLYMDIFKKYLERNNIYSIQKVKEIIHSKRGQYGILRKYYDYTEKKTVYLPERFIFSICGSNGLCSGNTKYEAFCQGLCEVFERYVNYQIYFDKELTFPTIEKHVYEGLNSYTMIQALEEKGYNVYVKDCTLNGVFPVLGVLVTNHSRTKYYFKLGSDINMDICLQRCITEMFQGLDINTTFRLQLKDIDDSEYDAFWRLSNVKEEYYKTVRTGEGRIPRNVFINAATSNSELKPFIKGQLSNVEVVEKLSNIATECGMHIYIKDYSYLGFNTMSIYIPGFSEIIDYDYGIAELQGVFEQVRRVITKEPIDIAELDALLVRIVSEDLVSADYTINELLGLNLNQNYQGILKCNIYLLIAWLKALLMQEKECEKWLDKYHNLIKMNKREATIEAIIFQAITAKVSMEALLEYLEVIITEKEKERVIKKVRYYYQLRETGIHLNACNRCDDCELHTCCNYTFINKLKSNLNCKYLKYEQEFDYTDEFYK